MPNTVNRGYPYPNGGDQAAVHTDIKTPLEWIDTDVQALSDTVQTKVTGQGANRLWVGTYTEYDLIGTYDPDTVYVIRGGERDNPGKRWGLGVPAVTNGVMSYSLPDLPALGDDWGYLAIIIGQNPVAHTWWVAPAGWTRLADQSDDEGSTPSRPMGIFKAPSGTPTGIFNVPAHGAGHHIAMVFPCKTEPTNEGFIRGTTGGADDIAIPSMVFQNPAHPITIASTHYTSMTTTVMPTMTGADYNRSNPSPIAIGDTVSVLHVLIGESPRSYAGGESYDLTRTPTGMYSAWRIGVGSA